MEQAFPIEADFNDKKQKTYIANPDFMMREISGECVLVPLGDTGFMGNSVLMLNDSCRFLWELFQKPHTVDEAVLEAQKIYEESEELPSDIRQFVEEYLSAGLLKEE